MTATYTISIIIRMSHLVEEAHTAAPSFSVAYQSWAHGSDWCDLSDFSSNN